MRFHMKRESPTKYLCMNIDHKMSKKKNLNYSWGWQSRLSRWGIKKNSRVDNHKVITQWCDFLGKCKIHDGRCEKLLPQNSIEGYRVHAHPHQNHPKWNPRRIKGKWLLAQRIYLCSNKQGHVWIGASRSTGKRDFRKTIRKNGFAQTQHTLGKWKHHSKPIQFTLVVDDFSVKYNEKQDTQYLIKFLQ